MNGVIKRLVSDKGFGFIAEDSTKVEHFFHRSGVIGTRFEHLKEGDTVTFESAEGEKGPRAESVSLRN